MERDQGESHKINKRRNEVSGEAPEKGNLRHYATPSMQEGKRTEGCKEKENSQ
jgi:hypothetical protein